VLLIGSAAILLGEQLPEGIDPIMERVVGVTLVLLGVFVFVSLIRHGREFRMRSRWMLIFSGTRTMVRSLRRTFGSAEGGGPEREPVHVHDDAGRALAVAEDIPVTEWHHGHHGRPGHHHHDHPETDPFMNYSARSAFVVGMIHGVGAETPTQILIFLTAVTAGGKLVGEGVLVVFLLGLLSSNSLITAGSSFGFLRASRNWPLYVTVAVLTGVFSLVIGVMFLLGKGSLLPALFGG
jgi:high-affinity nickel-transport protein